MRTGQNSYFLVVAFTTAIAGMGLAFVLFILVLRMRREHVFIGGRIDEEIDIIDLNRISNLSYNDKLFEISIDGMMVEN